MSRVLLPWVHPSTRARRDMHIDAEDRKQQGRLCQETRRIEMSQRRIRAAAAPPLGDEGTDTIKRARRIV
jgi:hypothetical protein